jgi:hypothetical protein
MTNRMQDKQAKVTFLENLLNRKKDFDSERD